MSVPVFVPRIGVTVEEVTLLRWLVADGDVVSAGQVIAEIETDKVESELEAPASGVICLRAEPGEACAVGSVIGNVSPPA